MRLSSASGPSNNFLAGVTDPAQANNWGLRITEMMWGTLESARTGRKYAMTTTLDY